MHCTEFNFRPNWAISPGATIIDILKDRSISFEQFSNAIGEAGIEARELLHGRIAINTMLAERLGDFFGTPKAFWITRETQYRQDLDRLNAEEDSVESVSRLLKQLPIKDMVEFGWIPKCSEHSDYVDEALRFFDSPNIQALQPRFKSTLQNTAFRTSLTYDSHEVAAAVWLRQGEREAERLECGAWDAEAFRSQLSSIRSLTRQKDPLVFLPSLRALCAACGVAVVIVRAPTGCRASGATKFLSPTKALLMLSFRYLSDDHFWFTFFHEAAHLLLHNNELVFMESKETCSTKEEEEANLFSSAFLIPPEFEQELCSLPHDAKAIMRFARKIGISAGVVVGQLQFRNILGHSEMSRLKNRFRWD
jgi:HTH-type transcriptional regulator / antitoxin HigA